MQSLESFQLTNMKDAVRAWYDGYSIGTMLSIYNPWSMLHCIESGGLLRPYWVNTSENDIVKQSLRISDETVKVDLEALIAGASIYKKINDTVVL